MQYLRHPRILAYSIFILSQQYDALINKQTNKNKQNTKGKIIRLLGCNHRIIEERASKETLKDWN